MQKNVPKYTPDCVHTVHVVGGDVEARRALRGVQRPAHAAVVREPARGRVPPDAGDGRRTPIASRTSCSTSIRPRATTFAMAVEVAHLVRQALDDVGLAGAVKTSGAKGVHIFVPIDEHASLEDSAAAHRAIAARAERLDPKLATTAFIKEDREGKVFVDSTRVGGATVVAAYSPRVRPGTPVSFPLAWDELDDVAAVRLHGPHRARRARRPRSAGPSTCPLRNTLPRSSSPRATRSRSRGCRRCTRASAASEPGAI